jgi:hypothetical protein
VHEQQQRALQGMYNQQRPALSDACIDEGTHIRTVCDHCSDPLADVKRIAKKIQGSLPIVGLLSRLSAPAGGFDEIVSDLSFMTCA